MQFPPAQNSSPWTSWLEIDLDAIRGNVRRLAEIAGRPVLAVVKANAYGHGVLPVARAALQAGAYGLAVARFEEAWNLRQAGVEGFVLILGNAPPEWAAQAAAQGVRLALYDPEQAQAVAARAQADGVRVPVHLKIDSGMGRLGVPAAQAIPFVRWAAQQPSLQVEGLFTHFARADEPGAAATQAQLRAFTHVVRELEAAGLRPPLVHAANSAATLTLPEAYFDLVRPGIALYGLHPSAPECTLPHGFRPAMAWKARLTSVKTLPPGHGVGYGHTYVTRGAERIGVIPVGYADGLRRGADNRVLIGGRELPVIRRVCMDQTMLVLDAVPEARSGDEVVLIGRQGGGCISAEDVAARWGTNNYEVACAMAERLPRVLLNA